MVTQYDNEIVCPVDNVLLESLFAYFVRNRAVFEAAKDRLLPEHFNNFDEAHFAVIWNVLLQYYKKYNDLPQLQALSTEVVRLLQANNALPEVIKNAINLIEWFFSDENSLERLPTPVGMTWLRYVLLDRRVSQPLRETDVSNVVALPRLLNELSVEINQINSVDSTPDDVAIPEKWYDGVHGRELITTGIPFIDSNMQTYAGEVNVLLGPMGVGKTLLGIQMAASTARSQYQKQQRGGIGRPCAYFGYEGNIVETRIRVISFVADIHKDRLMTMKSYDELSTSNNLQPYEIERFRAQLAAGKPVSGERERVVAASKWLNDYLKLYDFSGAPGADGIARGHGGISEIRHTLDAVAQKTGQGFSVVVIDWAGMMLRRYLETQNKPLDRHMSLELLRFVDQVRTEIALPFNSVVYVLHQLRGQVNRLSPTARVTHADAEWCSSFAVNAWYAMCLGTKDNDTSTCTLSWTKTRHGPATKIVVCKIDGAFSRMLDASEDYVLDVAQNRIVSRQERAIAFGETNQDTVQTWSLF